MQFKILPQNETAREVISAYEGFCRPLPCQVEQDGELDVLSVERPSTMLFGPIEVTGAEGGRWLADNGGAGFSENDGTIDFAREAARTRLREVAGLASRLAAEGMPGSSRSAEFQAAAEAALEAGQVQEAIDKIFWAGETLVEAETDWRLASGDCKLDLGINTKGLHNAPEAWDKHFAPRFNYATIPLTWGVLEVERGKPRYDVLDELVAWCKRHGMRMKGHALIWHSMWERSNGVEEDPYEQMIERSTARTRTLLERFGSALDCVELINEPMQYGFLTLTADQQIDEVERVYQLCKEIAPQVRIMISFYAEDEWWFVGRWRKNPDVIPVGRFIERCIERGVEIDVLGHQQHFPENFFNLRQVSEHWYERFSLPVHITELTPSSGAQPSKSTRGRPMQPSLKTWRGRPWSEDVQADYVRQWLRFFRAMPFIENATFWGTTDAPILWHDYLLGAPNETYRLPWAAGQGLLREDLTPKPALDEVR
jgi:GH35 family endo-1,4-beta-xylanase